MIAFIKGTVDSLSEGKMILESHGIGYELNIPASMFDAGIREGEELKIYTHMSVREDGISLFGFLSREDLEIYRMLIGVSGIGPKRRLRCCPRLLQTICALPSSRKMSRRLPKHRHRKETAQKLILELKDKFDLQEAFEQKLAGNQAAAAVRQTGEPDAFQDAVQALTALGYSGTEALQAVKKVEITEGMDSEAVLKAALKHMF